MADEALGLTLGYKSLRHFCRNVKKPNGLFNRGLLVGGFDVADGRGFGSDLVDTPAIVGHDDLGAVCRSLRLQGYASTLVFLQSVTQMPRAPRWINQATAWTPYAISLAVRPSILPVG